jgi:hypothetical protein
MSITKKGSKRANDQSLKGKYSQRYVVPETTIRNFVGSLSAGDIDSAAVRLQIVADVTSHGLDKQIEHLDQSVVRLIEDLARESTNKHYLRIMRAILASIKQGPRGIDCAHLTAGRVVELAFSWTLNYFSALDQYREKLRKMRQAPKE